MSSNASSSVAVDIFSTRRFFINNLDSYHSKYYIEDVNKVIEDRRAAAEAAAAAALPPPVYGEDAQEPPPPPPEQPFELIGNVIDSKKTKIKQVSRIVPKEEILSQMMTCGTVIYDISYANAEELKIIADYIKLLTDLFKKQQATTGAGAGDANPDNENRRILILISTIMTWGCTKPLDPDNPEMPFVETDFRKRRPHPNYKPHYSVESDVILLARNFKHEVGATVVCSGLTYGGKEDVLFYWFQKAWECEPILPIFGRGNNFIPTINVIDLSQIVKNLLMEFPKKLYMLAIEQTVARQREIIKSLGRTVGTAMFKCIKPEDAFLIKEIDQRIFDLMTLNLNMEPGFIVETMGLQFDSDLPFAENVPALIKQFKKDRKLKPFKILIYGPPLVGKTTLAKQICESYGLVYVSPETVVQDTIDDLTWRIEHWEKGEKSELPQDVGEEEVVEDEDDTEEDKEEKIENAKQTLAMLKSGRPLTPEEILGYLRGRLLMRDAENRGWVLDGLPYSLAQVATLFEKGEEEEEDREKDMEEEQTEEQFEEDITLYDGVLRKLLPDIVVSLEATDEFVCEKAMRQPEYDAYLDEENVLRRLREFRTNDARDVTPLNFFDELDIHPMVVPVKSHDDYEMREQYAAVTLRMGGACKYGKLIALVEAAEKKAKQELANLKAQEAKALKEIEDKIKQDREDRMEYWSELYSIMRDEEEAALVAAGEPMRTYLMTHIFPTLTPALIEIAKVRPDDPVDYLAELLFKTNPSGKMFPCGFNLQRERGKGRIKILDPDWDDLQIIIPYPSIHEITSIEEENQNIVAVDVTVNKD